MPKPRSFIPGSTINAEHSMFDVTQLRSGCLPTQTATANMAKSAPAKFAREIGVSHLILIFPRNTKMIPECRGRSVSNMRERYTM